MQNSVIMKRVLILLVTAILLAAMLTTVFYSITSNIVFTRITTNEFRNKASWLASKSAQILRTQISTTYYEGILGTMPEMLDATVGVVINENNKMYLNFPSTTDFDEQAKKEIAEVMLKQQKDILLNGYAVERLRFGEKKLDTLVVGFPIVVQDESSGVQSIEGSVYILRSFDNIKAGHDSLDFALIFASCIAFLLMIFPTIMAVSRLVKPLRQMTSVALAMAGGNFSLRADSHQAGEIGDLATAVNDLAAALDRSISALMVERNRLQQILDGISEGILAVDADMVITHLNPATKKLFKGLKSHGGDSMKAEDEYAAALEHNDLSLSNDLRQQPFNIAAVYQQAMEMEKVSSRSFQVGEKIILLQVSPLFNNAQNLIGAVGLFRDITAAEQLEQTRREYIANVSHELRTPLTALRGLIEPLSDGLVNDESDRVRYYGIILGETLRLSRLIDDMLELSRLQSGKLSLKMQNFDLSDVLDNLKNKYKIVAERQGISLLFPPDETLPAVYGNADRTEQILIILIDNALKFTQAGGEINIRIYDTPKKLELSVQDSGPGIAPADVDRVFERFYKAEKSRGKSGTGLGLSIAKEIMHAMHESIWVESKAGQGARFTFTLTKAEAEDF